MVMFTIPGRETPKKIRLWLICFLVASLIIAISLLIIKSKYSASISQPVRVGTAHLLS